MTLPTIEVYSDIHCPWAYMATYRLRRVWPEYAVRLQVVWRSLALEYRNERGTPKRILDAETALITRIEPDLPLQPWVRPDWQWPVTFWPAFEALACAQAQSPQAGFVMSWELRRAFFGESRVPSLRHDLLAIAHAVARTAELDLDRFERDWDSGRYKGTVIADSRRGWDELKVKGSPTFVLPDGRQITNPAAGHADVDEEHGVVRSYLPFEGDPLVFFRAMLDSATQP